MKTRNRKISTKKCGIKGSRRRKSRSVNSFHTKKMGIYRSFTKKQHGGVIFLDYFIKLIRHLYVNREITKKQFSELKERIKRFFKKRDKTSDNNNGTTENKEDVLSVAEQQKAAELEAELEAVALEAVALEAERIAAEQQKTAQMRSKLLMKVGEGVDTSELTEEMILCLNNIQEIWSNNSQWKDWKFIGNELGKEVYEDLNKINDIYLRGINSNKSVEVIFVDEDFDNPITFNNGKLIKKYKIRLD